MKFVIAGIIFLSLTTSAFAAADDGMPFGDITDANFESFTVFAKSKGLDVDEEMAKIYAQKDVVALGRVFQFSTKFSKLDMNCRTYGQMIYSSFLNLGESWGVKSYAKVIDVQVPEVRQRIRDFIFFPVTTLPKNIRSQIENENREAYPAMFPADYEFGRGNPIFAN